MYIGNGKTMNNHPGKIATHTYLRRYTIRERGPTVKSRQHLCHCTHVMTKLELITYNAEGLKSPNKKGKVFNWAKKKKKLYNGHSKITLHNTRQRQLGKPVAKESPGKNSRK